MEKTRLSSKGQIVLPKSIRDARHWAEGTEFVVEPHEDGVLLRPARPFPTTSLDEVYGIAAYRGRPVSIAAMDRAIAKEVKARRDRGRF